MPAAPRTPTPARTGSGPGRPKDLAKREAILRAAMSLFLEQGYTGTSMDTVAQTAGVSKLTVYSHFGDTEGLFNATVQATCASMVPATLFQPDVTAPLRDQLMQIARAVHSLVGSPVSLATQRMLLDPATDPHIREVFWQAGPQPMTAAFVAFLTGHVAAGHLAIADIERSADLFFYMVNGEPLTRLIYGQTPPPGGAASEDHLAAAVDLFLRAHVPDES